MTTSPCRRRPLRRGLTLLEVVVALAVFLFAIVAISQLVNIGSDRALDVKMQSKASMLCQSKLFDLVSGVDPLQGVSWTAFPTTDDADYQYEVEVSDGETTSLKNVRVSVKRDRTDGRTVQVSLTQMVMDPAQRGSTLDRPVTTAPSTTGGTTP